MNIYEGLIIGIVMASVFWLVYVYNHLVNLKNLVKNSWSDIDVHLKKRHDLIPNLVEIVSSYMKHEKSTLESVVKARSAAMDSRTHREQIDAELSIEKTLPTLLAVAEQYPDLKADSQFANLHAQLVAVEDDLANSRRYYNAVVRDFNSALQVFPNNLVSGGLGYKEEPFFQIDRQEQEVPEMKL